MQYTYHETDIGPLLLAGEDGVLLRLSFPEGDRTVHPDAGWERHSSAFADACRALDQYFAGRLREFDIPARLVGTAFQCSVWQALREIPYGETRSYAQIATAIGNPKAVRAVGAANGANPIPIIFPCHRVIGANGSLTGFGGGIELKSQLLSLEGANCAAVQPLDLFAAPSPFHRPL